jgi:hypothetical protein
MCGIGFVKRFLPFVATLVVGLFIASFFVDLTAPQFEVRGRGWRRFQEVQQLRIDNQQLRDENRRLTQQLNEARTKNAFDDSDMFSPPPPPPAPMAPRRIR